MAAYWGMRTGRPKKPLEIVAADREKLSMIARRPKSAQAMAMRARIVLGCERGDEQFRGRPQVAHHRRHGR